MKNSNNTIGDRTCDLRLVVQCLNQLHHCASYKTHCVCISVRQTCSTIIKLAVLLLTVHNVEQIRNISLHVAHFKIEPLMMVSRVNIWHQDQVILIWRNLKYTSKDCNILAMLETSNEGCGTGDGTMWDIMQWVSAGDGTLWDIMQWVSAGDGTLWDIMQWVSAGDVGLCR